MFGKVNPINAAASVAGFVKDNVNPGMMLSMLIGRLPGDKAALVRQHAPGVFSKGADVPSMMNACEDIAAILTGNPDAKSILQSIPLWTGIRGVSKEGMPAHCLNIAKEKGIIN